MFGGASGLDNVGTLRVESGVLDMRTPFRQFSGGRLTGGRIEVANGARIIFFPRLTSIAGELRLEHTAHLDVSFGTNDHSLLQWSRIEPTGALELVGQAADGAFSSAHISIDVVNEGRLRVENHAGANARTYTQTATGVYEIDGGADTQSSGFSTRTATLAGTLRIIGGVPGQEER